MNRLEPSPRQSDSLGEADSPDQGLSPDVAHNDPSTCELSFRSPVRSSIPLRRYIAELSDLH